MYWIVNTGLPWSSTNPDQNPGTDPKYCSMPTIADQVQWIPNNADQWEELIGNVQQMIGIDQN